MEQLVRSDFGLPVIARGPWARASELLMTQCMPSLLTYIFLVILVLLEHSQTRGPRNLGSLADENKIKKDNLGFINTTKTKVASERHPKEAPTKKPKTNAYGEPSIGCLMGGSHANRQLGSSKSGTGKGTKGQPKTDR